MSVAKSVQDATEKAARMRSQAEAKVEKKVTEQGNLERSHAASTKKLREEYDKRIQLEQQAYEIAKKKIGEEVDQEKAKREETRKEAEAMVAQAKKAFENVAAASMGSTQVTGDGQQSAATVAASGAVLVPTLPGYILH